MNGSHYLPIFSQAASIRFRSWAIVLGMPAPVSDCLSQKAEAALYMDSVLQGVDNFNGPVESTSAYQSRKT